VTQVKTHSKKKNQELLQSLEYDDFVVNDWVKHWNFCDKDAGDFRGKHADRNA